MFVFVGWKEIMNAFFYNLTKNMNAGWMYPKQKLSGIDCPEVVQCVRMWSEANEWSANEGGKSLYLLLHLLTNEQLLQVLSGALARASS